MTNLPAMLLVSLSLAATQVCAQTDADLESFEHARKTKAVIVTSLARSPETPESREAGCELWKISRDDVAFFFAHAELLTNEEFHSYDVFPCAYSGWLSVNGRDYRFGINVGRYGNVILAQPDKYVLYGCKRVCEKLFQ